MQAIFYIQTVVWLHVLLGIMEIQPQPPEHALLLVQLALLEMLPLEPVLHVMHHVFLAKTLPTNAHNVFQVFIN